MVRLWDDIFALAERAGVRLLLTPYDTFWMWLHWRHHPYNTKNGGPLSHPSRLLLCPETRKLIKARLTFAVRRWGGSGALFAWDLWNEIHPAQAENKADVFPEFIADLSRHVRAEEERLYARSHPQTVSLFGPELEWKPHMPLREPVFRHPDLDFTNVHIYQQGSIDDPQNTIDGAVAMARIVREHTSQVPAGRPYFDSEHGPIHAFKDRKKTLPEVFDDEYFRHMQWAHLAAGGAGGGMRWPNRSPHRLTPGMGLAQKAFSEFLPEINWRSFRRGPYDIHLATQRHVAAIASGDESQAVVYLLRTDRLSPAGMIDRGDPAASLDLRFRGCTRAAYSVTAWDTRRGVALARTIQAGSPNGMAYSTPPFNGDVALAIRCVE
jgi:mannan endo-1,4-beta-mannosidase